MSGWVHNDNDGWDYIDQFKYSEQKDRANLQWADVNGDGKADMIWTDKFTGDGSVWYNLGPRDIKGSRYEWGPQGALYRGAVAGPCTYYPDLNGGRRADMHSILNSIDNTAHTWYNGCVDQDHTGDDGPPAHPGLLKVPQENPESIWDNAPDFSNDPYPPYPPLTNSDGSNILVSNLRGTRLFGWMGCSQEEAKMIS